MAKAPPRPSTTPSQRTQQKQKRKHTSLKTGRPPLLSSAATTHPGGGPLLNAPTAGGHGPASSPSLSLSASSKHTRTVIRSHHVLQKRLAHARSEGDTDLVRELEAQLAAEGGLKTYQLASTLGQSAERGGDSSRVLVQWLRDEIEARRHAVRTRSSSDSVETRRGTSSNSTPLRILEVGALSTTNALNVPGVTRVRRIDLRSSGPGIEEADFMTLPLPHAADGDGDSAGVWEGGRGYDVLSLSLVLNYVPDARGRGDMLKRTTMFFARRGDGEGTTTATVPGPQRPLLPCLFLVLPAPTLHNSRYLTPDHLDAILSSLGYANLETKTTRKLHYSLWRYDASQEVTTNRKGVQTGFGKREINPGGGRNNFSIILDSGHVGDT